MASGQRAVEARTTNAFGFLRWFFAALVVVTHAVPIGGFPVDDDVLVRWSQERISLGTLAVLGFFTISGLLVTQSWVRTRDVRRFGWKRFLRIMPGYWVCLVVVTAVLAPIAWLRENHTLAGYLHASPGPIAFAVKDSMLFQRQPSIGDLFVHSPLARVEAPALNGSAWTLPYEVLCYAALAGVALIGLRRRSVWTVGGLAALGWAGVVVTHYAPGSAFAGILRSTSAWPFVALFFTAALAGVHDSVRRWFLRLGPYALVAFILLMRTDLWWIALGLIVPAVLWLGEALPWHTFDRHGDISYGTYLYAFPLQMLLADFGVNQLGYPAFTVVCLVAASAAGWVSWHLVEKRAMALKSVGLPILGRRAPTK